MNPVKYIGLLYTVLSQSRSCSQPAEGPLSKQLWLNLYKLMVAS